MEARFAENELIQALTAARTADNPEGAMTRVEMQSATGMSLHVLTARLHELKAMGMLTVVHVQRERLDGVMTRVPAYRLREVDSGNKD